MTDQPRLTPEEDAQMARPVCRRCLSADCHDPDSKGCSDNCIGRHQTTIDALRADLQRAREATAYWRCGCGELNLPARTDCGNCGSDSVTRADPLFGKTSQAPTDHEIVSSLRDLLDSIGFTDPESHANPVKCVKIVGEEMFQHRETLEQLRKILQPGVSMADCPLVETAKKLVEAHQGCQFYLKDGERPHECIERHLRDLVVVNSQLQDVLRELDELRGLYAAGKAFEARARELQSQLEASVRELQDGHLRIDECATQDAKGQPIRERISAVIERLVYAKQEEEHLRKAVGAEMDSMRAQLSAAEHRRAAAEYRATRIELDKELQAKYAAIQSSHAAQAQETRHSLGSALCLMNVRKWVDAGIKKFEREHNVPVPRLPGPASDVAGEVWLAIQMALDSQFADERPTTKGTA